MSNAPVRRTVPVTLVASALAALALSPVARGQSADDEIEFLEPLSMLFQADQQATGLVGSPDQWSGPFMDPQPEEFRSRVTNILTIYPRSVIPEPGASILATLGSDELWDALDDMGFDLMHALATERAGGIRDREFTPSVDGGFDRISYDIDPLFGTEEDMRGLVEAAADRDAIIAGDVIPLHTGLGADFWLATMNHLDYAGIYDMIQIPEEHWGLLPTVDDRWGYEVLTKDQARPLYDAGLIPGIFDVLLADPDSVDWSGWAATAEIEGADGRTRRWVYGHLFKPDQPMLNWLDPSYAARRIQAGDVVRHVYDLGIRVNRLDAVPFLGLDPQADDSEADVFMTQLAIAGTNDLAFLHRKLGGWTWVELNVPIDQFADFMEHGADIGYDFFTRAQTVHPLITQDARVLRIAHRAVLESDVDHRRLIHAMQNHDEITYQLLNLSFMDEVQLGDETLTGEELKQRILSEMRAGVTGDVAPRNKLYRPEEDGVATTFAGFAAAALGIDPFDASDEEVARILRAHVLLVMANAMQPGVFAISEWDLVGALPLEEEEVEDRMTAGDVRWVNRGGVDVMGHAPDASESGDGLPRAETLYGPLPEQLQDPGSFASQVRDILAARDRIRIAEAELVAVPDVADDAVAVLVMRLPESGGVAITALNYAREPTEITVDLSGLEGVSVGGASPEDAVSGDQVGSVSGGQVTIPLFELAGRTVILR